MHIPSGGLINILARFVIPRGFRRKICVLRLILQCLRPLCVPLFITARIGPRRPLPVVTFWYYADYPSLPEVTALLSLYHSMNSKLVFISYGTLPQSILLQRGFPAAFSLEMTIHLLRVALPCSVNPDSNSLTPKTASSNGLSG